MKPTRIGGLLALVLLLAVAGAWCSLGAETASALKPNIVFVLADDLGWSDLACYGSKVHQTPNLDRFARQNVRFTDAYAASPVCSPTRASLMTGKCPARLHITIWREGSQLPPRNRPLLPPITVANLPYCETCIAQRLHDAGYVTALVGKWHLGDYAHYPEDFGFDVNVGGTAWGCPATYFYPYRGVFDGDLRYVPHTEFGKPGEYLTDRLTDEALKIIDAAGSQPFFLYLAHHAVHTPIEAKAGDVELASEYLAKSGSQRNATYAAMVRNLDENFGRVMAHIQKRGLADRTIVIFFSDNGGYTGVDKGKQVTDNAPLRSGKGSLYEGGVREPLVVSWPGVTPRGVECHEPVISTDLFYTLLAMAGVPQPAAPCGDGLNLAGLMKNPQSHLTRDALFFHYPHYYITTSPVSSVRAGDYKLLEYYEDHHLELYNLRDDLSETTDLAARMADKARQLQARLRGWLAAVDAQIPARNADFKAQPAAKRRAK